jgi:prophage antirepressor-like protein
LAHSYLFPDMSDDDFLPPMQTVLMKWVFESHLIRTIKIKGEPWWVAVDVCKALTITNPSQAISRLDEDEKSTLINNEGGGRAHTLNIVNQPGLWSLVLSSTKPEAKRFKRWLTHEVLPHLLKTGSYTMPHPSRVAKQQKRLRSNRETAERRVEVIDGNKHHRARIARKEYGGGFSKFFDGVNKAHCEKTAAALRKDLGLKPHETPLDHMGEVALAQRGHALSVIARKIQDASLLVGRPLSDEEQDHIINDVVSCVRTASLSCFGPDYQFGVVDDARRGKLIDVVRQLTADESS